MKVSVICAVYNGQQFLGEAIDSVLGQSGFSTAGFGLEMLVVDDGSTDATDEVIASYGGAVRGFRQANRGQPTALNAGIVAAGGDAITFLDCDDLRGPGSLREQAELLVCAPEADIVVGQTQVYMPGPTLAPLDAEQDGTPLRGFVPFGPPRPIPSLANRLFRRRVFEAVGTLNPAERCSADVDFLARCDELGVPAVPSPGVAQLYRRHQGAMTNERAFLQKNFIGVVKRAMDRRHAA